MADDGAQRSGDDGTWFLEAVGAVPPSPTPSESMAALELDNTLLLQGTDLDGELPDTLVFDGGSATSTAAFEPPTMHPLLDNDATGELEITPSPSPPSSPLEAADPSLPPALRTRRTFRWSAALVVLLLGGALIATVLWLPAAMRADAAIVRQSLHDASTALRASLPTAQGSLDTLTDPGTPDEELASNIPILADLDSLARELQNVAADPLPRTYPILPHDEIDALMPLRNTGLIHAATGSAIARTLGHTYVYRTTIPTLLSTGELPTSAATQSINTLSVSLATALVETTTALVDLPLSDTAETLHTKATHGAERFASWQEEYLTALVEDDEEAAAALVKELDVLRGGLMTELDATLADFRMLVDADIVTLAGDLDTYISDLIQP